MAVAGNALHTHPPGEIWDNGAMRKHMLRIFAVLLVLQTTACEQAGESNLSANDSARGSVAVADHDDGFVDNRQCLDCHQDQAAGWAGSQHDLAMAKATIDTVLGDFNDTEFIHQGASSRFHIKDNRFLVNTEGPDGKRQDFEISYTFGVYPLQQYLVEFADGRLQALTIAWDSRPAEQGGQRWFHLLPDEVTPPGDPLHWTGRMHTWNVRCAECHSTNLRKNFDPDTNSYHTRWSEINVSCQSCHGPGADHVAWAVAGQGVDQVENYGLSVDYHAIGAQGMVETCARCHSRRHRVSPEDAHGRPLLDDFVPSTLQAGLYYPDGQILDEVYVYGSFLQSRMYNQGVACNDCHDVHSARLKKTGNDLCLQCHTVQPPARFPTLQAKEYDNPAHHFHKPGSAGAQCVNCHMPASTYMVIDPRRDHSFRIPRPDLSVKLEVPNACNQCHTEESAEWAAEKTAQWYGTAIRDARHYGETIAAARRGEADAYEDLVALATDSSRPPIITATALELLSQYPPAEPSVRALRDAAHHQDPLVRTVATNTLGQMPAVADLKTLSQQLHDPIRAVRMEAARILAPIPRQHLDQQQRRSLDSALQEYRDTQLALSDTPEALLNLGVLESALGDEAAAETYYTRAIESAPEFIPARVNLANLYNRTARNQLAEQQLRAAIGYEPDAGELYYSLGLLLAEEQRLNEAAGVLQTAADRLPRRARVQYNYALLLQNLERHDDAEDFLQRAYALDPQDSDIVYALVIFYSQDEDWQRALVHARQLQVLVPNDPGPVRLIQQLEQALSATAVP
jgi:predicted CXXCH cytochrome family protein